MFSVISSAGASGPSRKTARDSGCGLFSSMLAAGIWLGLARTRMASCMWRNIRVELSRGSIRSERRRLLGKRNPNAQALNILNMETNVERRVHNPIRSGMSWPRAVAWSLLVTALLFGFLNWRGCWLFMYGAEGLVVFAYPFSWLLICLVLRTRWRIVFVALTLLAAPVFSTRI